jgi:hypothetical protein
MRGSRRTPTCVLGDTGREALCESRDRAMWDLLPLFYSVYEAAYLGGGTSLSSLGRRHFPLHGASSLSRGFRNNSWHREPGPLGQNYPARLIKGRDSLLCLEIRQCY